MGVVTHPLSSGSTHNPSSWQYLQSTSRLWQIPATSTASLLKSAACICHCHLQWILYVAARESCYIVSDNTRHLVTRPCLPLGYPGYIFPQAVPAAEPLICSTMTFLIDSTRVTIYHCFYFYYIIWPDYTMLDSQNVFTVSFPSTSFAFPSMLGTVLMAMWWVNITISPIQNKSLNTALLF